MDDNQNTAPDNNTVAAADPAPETPAPVTATPSELAVEALKGEFAELKATYEAKFNELKLAAASVEVRYQHLVGVVEKYFENQKVALSDKTKSIFHGKISLADVVDHIEAPFEDFLVKVRSWFHDGLRGNVTPAPVVGTGTSTEVNTGTGNVLINDGVTTTLGGSAGGSSTDGHPPVEQK